MDFQGEERPSLGRIALLGRIGRGGMGVVYYGVNPRLGTEVAVKILPRDLEERQDDLIDRFVREARFAARLRSENLVGVLDVDRDDDSGMHYLVMEYVNGRSAADWLKSLHAEGAGGAPEALALDLCIAATRGLEAAHLEGIVHRDVKPGNILIPADAGGNLLLDQAKLADLGLARAEDSNQSLTGSKMAMGTPGYMAPEQAKDVKRAKKPADVFGIGATLYSLLTGNAPFSGETGMQAILSTLEGNYEDLRRQHPEISAATAILVDRCLDPDPEQRYPDASALLEALQVCRRALGEATAETAEITSMVRTLVERPEQGKRVITDPGVAPGLATGATRDVTRAAAPGPAPGAPGAPGTAETVPGRGVPRVRPAVLFGVAGLALAGVLAWALLGGDDDSGTSGSSGDGGSPGDPAGATAAAPDPPAVDERKTLPLDELRQRAEASEQAGKLEEARLDYAAILEREPGEPAARAALSRVLHGRAVELFVRAETNAALLRVTEALKYGNDPATRALLAWINDHPDLADPAAAARPLAFTALEPPQGTVIGAESLELFGRVRGALPHGFRVRAGDVEAAPERDGSFRLEVPLPEGPASIELEGTAAGERFARATRSVVVDRTPPQLAVEDPPAGHLTSQRELVLRGTAADSVGAVQLAIDGRSQGRVGPSWTARVPLQPGENRIELVATDDVGNERRATHRVLCDPSPPLVTLQQPAEGAFLRGETIEFSGILDDAFPDRVEVNGEPATLDDAGRFQVRLALPEGVQRVTVRGHDRAGNASTPVVRGLTVDRRAPTLTLAAPVPSGDGRVILRGDVDEEGCVVELDGSQVPLEGLRFEVRVPQPQGGPRTLVVRAVDRAGNETQRSTVIEAPLPLGAVESLSERWNLVMVRGDAGAVVAEGTRLVAVRQDQIVGYLTAAKATPQEGVALAAVR